MKNFKVLQLAALCAAFGVSVGAQAAVVTNTMISGNVIMGTGITNGGFTVSTDNAIEVGLRARERYPNPNNNTNDQAGTNRYNHATGGYTAAGVLGGPDSTRAAWNFDWSIDVGTRAVGLFTYRMGIDYNAGLGTNFVLFNPINGATTCADHSFGNLGTAQSAGVEVAGAGNANGVPACTGIDLGPDTTQYASLIAGNSRVQNSWNLDFFDTLTLPFDPNANGQYTIFLAAFSGGNEITRSTIEVIVGTGATATAVPEPTSLALIGLALAGLAATRRRA